MKKNLKRFSKNKKEKTIDGSRWLQTKDIVMDNDNKNVVKEQKEVQAKTGSYHAIRAATQIELTKEEQDLESQKSILGYNATSWQEIFSLDITNLDQAAGISIINLQKSYTAYLQRKKQFDNTIYVEPGKLPEIVIAAEKILLNEQNHIYQRSGKLVRVVQAPSSPASKNSTVKRASNAMIIKDIDQTYLIFYLTQIGNFVTFDDRSKRLKTIDCTEKISKHLISKQDWSLPVLTGIINAPTLRKDGSILERPGYDPQSGLLLFPGDCVFEKIPEKPTKIDAIKAKDELLFVLKDFPFEDDASQSVALAAILTALIRKSISTAPLFGFTAPKMASGKSLLADIIALIATGKPNSVIAQAENEAEEKKRIMSVLSEGDAIICYDNIEKPFKSAALCSILTQETYKDRLLGGNETRTVLTNATFLVTGNNLVFMGDISTRALLCKLDPAVERPEEREFTINLREHIPLYRGKLVKAALTILRAYHVANRPLQEIKQFGRFENWSNWVRSAIVWIDMTDPCESRKEIEESDPVRQLLTEFFAAWYGVFGDKSIKTRELTEQTITSLEETESKIEAYRALQEIIIEMAVDSKGIINQRRLAKQLSRYKNRIEGGFRLEQCEKHQGTHTWRVKKPKQ